MKRSVDAYRVGEWGGFLRVAQSVGGEGGVDVSVQRQLVGRVVGRLFDEDDGFRLSFGRKVGERLDGDAAVEDEGVVVDGQETQVPVGGGRRCEIGGSRSRDGDGFGVALKVEDVDAAGVRRDDVLFRLVAVDVVAGDAVGGGGIPDAGEVPGRGAALEEVRHAGLAVHLLFGLRGEADVPRLLADPGDEVGDGGGDELAHIRIRASGLCCCGASRHHGRATCRRADRCP